MTTFTATDYFCSLLPLPTANREYFKDERSEFSSQNGQQRRFDAETVISNTNVSSLYLNRILSTATDYFCSLVLLLTESD